MIAPLSNIAMLPDYILLAITRGPESTQGKPKLTASRPQTPADERWSAKARQTSNTVQTPRRCICINGIRGEGTYLIRIGGAGLFRAEQLHVVNEMCFGGSGESRQLR